MQNSALSADERVVPYAGLRAAAARGVDALLRHQRADGHWAFELEADATIPAEYILLDHFLGTVNQPLHERMAKYLRDIQEDHGGWPLFHRGDLNVSASVKAYFALKCVGDDIDAPHMIRAREAILRSGGAEKSNVFTRIQLALFGAVPWRAVPVMPVEIMLLPQWFPFHLYKVSYWSRTVIAPLLVLMAKKPQAKNPKNIKIDELFVTPPDQVKKWQGNVTASPLAPAFDLLDKVLRIVEPHMPSIPRQKAIDKAVAWVKERLNGEDGLGAIYPAMANAVMMFDCLGYAPDHPDYAIARKSVDKLVIDGSNRKAPLPPLGGRGVGVRGADEGIHPDPPLTPTFSPQEGGEGIPAGLEVTSDRSYCQPCLSPVWDTALATHALLEAGASRDTLTKACDWLKERQVLDVIGDWANWRPNARPGGWAFQYNNAHYPDLDDTAVVVMALDRFDRVKYREAIERGVEWVLGMQSKNGGWGAFDADNSYYYLNHIPFADHGALLDPPSADVTARCLSMLAQLGYRKDHPQVASAIAYLRREQEAEGCWFGRWGTNYIYGTWSVLCALNAIGIDPKDRMISRAVEWLKAKQRKDGGWGEGGESYWADKPKGEGAVSTPAQTAWALIALMAAGEIDSDAARRGIAWLQNTQKPDGTWDEAYYTAVGFPRVFYLRYHGYKVFFPQWALSRYLNLQSGNAAPVIYGM
ncbi:MAG: squalene--hopene cyclase [Alphaproteobacteria bacterium]|nr:squalene--hopene cyclase [Alphaproteobacteria bacterium]